MNYKIIETDSKYPDVLLYRYRDENGIEMVKIMAIGIIDDAENMFAIEEIEFERVASCQQFINDYSLASAEIWCEVQKITI
jgi:hypothetical protein